MLEDKIEKCFQSSKGKEFESRTAGLIKMKYGEEIKTLSVRHRTQSLSPMNQLCMCVVCVGGADREVLINILQIKKECNTNNKKIYRHAKKTYPRMIAKNHFLQF